MNKGVNPFYILGTILVCVCIFAMSSCGSCKRFVKDTTTNINAGTERTATLYDYNGKVIKRWEGHIDMSESRTETYLLIGEKRVVIHGGITVVEDK